jgi:glycosyltransferase involved in cell wall biosynthesis
MKISVVIPSYNRPKHLYYTLYALRHQTLDPNQFEVIVVDDGGVTDDENIVKEFSDVLNIRYMRQEDKGFRAGKARNIGIVAAEGDYIVFVDTGVQLCTTALAQHLALHEASIHPMAIIGYVYGFDAEGAMLDLVFSKDNWKNADRVIQQAQSVGLEDVRQAQYNLLGEDIGVWPAPFDIYYTAHASAERKELLKAGLFDESFNTWGGEDLELALRLFLRKNRFVMKKTLCSIHWPHERVVCNTSDRIKAELVANEKIRGKHDIWITDFYGRICNDAKYSLNRAIIENWPRSNSGNIEV